MEVLSCRGGCKKPLSYLLSHNPLVLSPSLHWSLPRLPFPLPFPLPCSSSPRLAFRVPGPLLEPTQEDGCGGWHCLGLACMWKSKMGHFGIHQGQYLLTSLPHCSVPPTWNTGFTYQPRDLGQIIWGLFPHLSKEHKNCTYFGLAE
jgi:hypothetical protein